MLNGYILSIIHGENSYFYTFDSHARNIEGMPDDNGCAVVMRCDDITELEQYICSLSEKLLLCI